MPDAWNAIRDFLQAGGPVLVWLAAVTFAMWALIAERAWYYRRAYPAERERVLAQWNGRADHSSWYAREIKRLYVSQLRLRLEQSLQLIKTLVAVCPLFGLLGTVTGMIEVFDVMAVTGSSNARAMASGVSKATIPTMAGMVAALSGLYLSVRLEHFARNETGRVEERMAGGADAA